MYRLKSLITALGLALAALNGFCDEYVEMASVTKEVFLDLVNGARTAVLYEPASALTYSGTAWQTAAGGAATVTVLKDGVVAAAPVSEKAGEGYFSFTPASAGTWKLVHSAQGAEAVAYFSVASDGSADDDDADGDGYVETVVAAATATMSLDLVNGVRSLADGETAQGITYSGSGWSASTGGAATVAAKLAGAAYSLDSTLVDSKAGEGTCEFTPATGGTWLLTHTDASGASVSAYFSVQSAASGVDDDEDADYDYVIVAADSASIALELTGGTREIASVADIRDIMYSGSAWLRTDDMDSAAASVATTHPDGETASNAFTGEGRYSFAPDAPGKWLLTHTASDGSVEKAWFNLADDAIEGTLANPYEVATNEELAEIAADGVYVAIPGGTNLDAPDGYRLVEVGDGIYVLEKDDSVNYTISWIVDGVTTSERVAEGVTPVWSGATPAKAADGIVTFTFNGWDPEIVAASADAAYTALFTAAAADEDAIVVANEDELAEALASDADPIKIVLAGDLDEIDVPDDKNVEIDLNGHAVDELTGPATVIAGDDTVIVLDEGDTISATDSGDITVPVGSTPTVIITEEDADSGTVTETVVEVTGSAVINPDPEDGEEHIEPGENGDATIVKVTVTDEDEGSTTTIEVDPDDEDAEIIDNGDGTYELDGKGTVTTETETTDPETGDTTKVVTETDVTGPVTVDPDPAEGEDVITPKTDDELNTGTIDSETTTTTVTDEDGEVIEETKVTESSDGSKSEETENDNGRFVRDTDAEGNVTNETFTPTGGEAIESGEGGFMGWLDADKVADAKAAPVVSIAKDTGTDGGWTIVFKPALDTAHEAKFGSWFDAMEGAGRLKVRFSSDLATLSEAEPKVLGIATIPADGEVESRTVTFTVLASELDALADGATQAFFMVEIE